MQTKEADKVVYDLGKPMDNEDRTSFDKFKDIIEQSFWAFSGYSKYKKNNIYLQRNEVYKFLEICNITEPSPDEIFREMDSEIVDNQISFSEFVNYFCDPNVNPGCYDLQKYMEEQVNFQILKEALRILYLCSRTTPSSTLSSSSKSTSTTTKTATTTTTTTIGSGSDPTFHKSEFTGRIGYGQFQIFAKELLQLNPQQTEVLWNEIDTDNSGDIRIDEVFDWLYNKLLEKQIEKDAQTGTLRLSQSS
ncbi:hypothetical protein RFI_23275 [Reticulomyxa filosa]|uniref:EF-hand domain-containing protein n=1 Tax=Reticulomyxa filosa TaxID=46433 RepID=X6MKA8_RETFI|nr:hypothetical protein RFI_23275 [Reticulomyxa filosa]|eukprot:ETO14096.1 hypothetical protein RFI_23275 [Reticulomyxa filosa]